MVAKKREAMFAEFLYVVPLGDLISLWNIQGACGRGIPAQQKFEPHLTIAQEMGWLKKVADDEYQRIGPKRSAYGRQELQVLKDRLACGLDGGDWDD